MIRSLIGLLTGGILGGTAAFFLGVAGISPPAQLESTQLLVALAKLSAVVGGGLGAVAGALVGLAGDLSVALRRPG